VQALPEQELNRPSLIVGHRFGRWLEVAPEPAARAVLEEACLLEQVGSVEEAIRLLGDALLDIGPHSSLLEARGALYLSVGFPRAAAGDFQNALTLSPRDARIHFALGHAYAELGLWRQALETLERAPGTGPHGTEVALCFARIHRALGHSGIAARWYQKGLTGSEARTTEILASTLALAGEDPERLKQVEEVHSRLEACLGTQAESWLVRQLLHESPGESEREIATAVQTLELTSAQLSIAAQRVLLALQLTDPTTSAATREELLRSEGEEARRAALERCLPRL
jgi:tetratricopeptide (TPR) repeat protein